MRQIINRRMYDTDKARYIGECRHGNNQSDPGYWEAALYQSPRSSQYFLAGEGNWKSQYARAVGPNSLGGGKRIDPLTPDEAYTWAEKHLEPEIVEREFRDKISEA